MIGASAARAAPGDHSDVPDPRAGHAEAGHRDRDVRLRAPDPERERGARTGAAVLGQRQAHHGLSQHDDGRAHHRSSPEVS
jgi:hypothetical protein